MTRKYGQDGKNYQIERNIIERVQKIKRKIKKLRHTIEYRVETENRCFRKERFSPMDEIVRGRIS